MADNGNNGGGGGGRGGGRGGKGQKRPRNRGGRGRGRGRGGGGGGGGEQLPKPPRKMQNTTGQPQRTAPPAAPAHSAARTSSTTRAHLTGVAFATLAGTISEGTLRAIDEVMGYPTMTQVQEQALPICAAGGDAATSREYDGLVDRCRGARGALACAFAGGRTFAGAPLGRYTVFAAFRGRVPTVRVVNELAALAERAGRCEGLM